MKNTAQTVDIKIDTNQLKQLLQQQGIPQQIIEDAVKLIEDKTKQTQNQTPQTSTTPNTPNTMNPIPTIMKPAKSRYLDLATKYLAVWAEPAKPLGPNADIPTLAEAGEDNDKPAADKKGKGISVEEVKKLGEAIGIDWENSEFSPETLAQGYEVELEHGTVDSRTDVTQDNPEATAKIAWAHLNEHPEYYGKLAEMEAELKRIDRPELTASMRRSAMTVRELQESVLPRLEDQLFEIDVALQSNMLLEAREVLQEAEATLQQIRDKINTLGDVDPVTFGPSESEKRNWVDKLVDW